MQPLDENKQRLWEVEQRLSEIRAVALTCKGRLYNAYTEVARECMALTSQVLEQTSQPTIGDAS